jgi:hypothetical protein
MKKTAKVVLSKGERVASSSLWSCRSFAAVLTANDFSDRLYSSRQGAQKIRNFSSEKLARRKEKRGGAVFRRSI